MTFVEPQKCRLKQSLPSSGNWPLFIPPSELSLSTLDTSKESGCDMPPASDDEAPVLRTTNQLSANLIRQIGTFVGRDDTRRSL